MSGCKRVRGGGRGHGSDHHNPSPPPTHVSVEPEQSMHQELKQSVHQNSRHAGEQVPKRKELRQMFQEVLARLG